MPSRPRLTRIEVPFHWLVENDVCHHFGEYTSGGGYGASDTNHWISNFKKKPTVPAGELYWKGRAIEHWAKVLRELLPPDQVAQNITFVPVPGSKPQGHPEYDTRMMQLVERWARGVQGVDFRTVLIQTAMRQSQHESARQSPDEILQTLAIDRAQLTRPLHATVVVVDDVLTLGASFKAAQRLLLSLPNVRTVEGLFLARTVWNVGEF